MLYEWGRALLLEDGEVISFGVKDVFIVGWFEVFPITAERFAEDVYSWSAISEPFHVIGSAKVWREEGHTSPVAAGYLVKVHAGIKLLGASERCMLFLSSDANPFVINLAFDAQAVAGALEGHLLE